METATACVRIRCPFRFYRGFGFYSRSGFIKNAGGDFSFDEKGECIIEIKADASGLAKLERMKVAIELMEKHILKSIKKWLITK